MAEGEGFEPSIRLPVYTLSKRAPSATRPPLLKRRNLADWIDLGNHFQRLKEQQKFCAHFSGARVKMAYEAVLLSGLGIVNYRFCHRRCGGDGASTRRRYIDLRFRP